MSSGLEARPLVEDAPPLEPDVLIEEARRRARRRRIGYVIAVLLAVIGASIGLIFGRGGASAKPTLAAVTPRSPLTVDARAFQGHGVLAFVSKGSLYVLDGATGRLVHLADRGFTASDPTLSHDGKWLAYLETATRSLIYDDGRVLIGQLDGAGAVVGQIQLSQVWIARADGQDAHELGPLHYGQIVGWSPTRDVLALVNEPPQRSNLSCKTEQTTSVELATPPDALRTVYSQRVIPCKNPEAFYGAVWSPDGRYMAIATTDFKSGSDVFTINLGTGARRTWFSIRSRQLMPGLCSGCVPDGVIADLAGWSRKWGILFSVFSSGMTRNNDGSPLEAIRSPGASPTEVGVTLSDGTDTELTSSRTGALAIVDAGQRDIASGGTEVQTCQPRTAHCTAIPGASVWSQPVSFTCHPIPRVFFCSAPAKPGSPDSGVTLDPAWSPSGSLLAYVRGPAAPQAATSTAQWLDYHELFLYNPATTATRGLPGTAGASAPQWSADGKSILYVSKDSLWLLSIKSERSVRIAGPLFGGKTFESAYPSYYHQVPFAAQFGWWS